MMSKHIVGLLGFYASLERPLTFLEIQRLTSYTLPSEDLLKILDELVKEKNIICSEGFYSLSGYKILERKWQDVLLDKKWRKLMRLRFFFSLLPFVNFVFISGSLALGNVHEHSDFDVLIGCKEGRVFTARFFSNVLFILIRKRREAFYGKDRICLNHYITPSSYALKKPYALYPPLIASLVPFYGSKEEMDKFIKANRLTFLKNGDRRFIGSERRLIAILIEKMLKGTLGDMFERLIKRLQIPRIRAFLKSQHVISQDGIILSDKEIELHPNTKKIENIVQKQVEYS